MPKGLKHCRYTYHRHVAIRIFSGLLVRRSYGEAMLCSVYLPRGEDRMPVVERPSPRLRLRCKECKPSPETGIR